MAETAKAKWVAGISADNAAMFVRLIGKHLKTMWPAYLFAAGAVYLFNENYQFGYNRTPSLPHTFFLIHVNEPVRKGDFVAFKWNGSYPYKKGQVFVKIVAGAEGDEVKRNGREFTIDGSVVGVAKTHGLRGQELEAAAGGVIGPKQYYVKAPHKDSLDSRYSMLGLVNQRDVIGRAYAIF